MSLSKRWSMRFYQIIPVKENGYYFDPNGFNQSARLEQLLKEVRFFMVYEILTLHFFSHKLLIPPMSQNA
jgi:hypothetical protein